MDARSSRREPEIARKMVKWEDPELTSHHVHTKAVTVCNATYFEKHLKTGE